jgi:hypothetical protein
MLDVIIEIVGDVIFGLLEGGNRPHENHLPTQKIPDRATVIRQRRRLRRKRQNMYGREKK